MSAGFIIITIVFRNTLLRVKQGGLLVLLLQLWLGAEGKDQPGRAAVLQTDGGRSWLGWKYPFLVHLVTWDLVPWHWASTAFQHCLRCPSLSICAFCGWNSIVMNSNSLIKEILFLRKKKKKNLKSLGGWKRVFRKTLNYSACLLL